MRSKLSFAQIKDHLSPWLRENLHWVKEDYIQARRISNIGLLMGGTKAVDRDGTRATLEQAIKAEIGRQVKLDLRLRRTTTKNETGKAITSEIISVSVDSRQVSEAVCGLRSVLHKTVAPPTGRKMFLLTQTSNEETKRKSDLLLRKHHEIVQQERRSYAQTGLFIKQPMYMKNSPDYPVTFQQAMCSLRASNGQQLFTGVERMGNSPTTLFTHTQSNTMEARKTIKALPTVLKSILTEETYNGIADKISGTTVAELTALQLSENTYLDGLLTTHHYAEIGVHRKRKKMEDGTDGATAISGLTQVSMASSAPSSPLGKAPTPNATYKEALTHSTQPSPAKTDTTQPPSMITILQQRLDQQKDFIQQMQQETAKMKKTMDLLQENMIMEQKKEETHRAWQSVITNQLTKNNEATQNQHRSISELNSHALHTSKALQRIMNHLNIPLQEEPTHPNPTQPHQISQQNPAPHREPQR